MFKKKGVLIFFLIVIVFIFSSFLLFIDNKDTFNTKMNNTYLNTKSIINLELENKIIEEKRKFEEKKIIHIPTPEAVKSLYFTAYATQTDYKVKNLIKLKKDKGINSITVDIKTVSGYTSFDLGDFGSGYIQPYSNNIINDIEGLIKKLHDNDIYVIGRIVVFKDKLLSEKRPDLAIKALNTGKVWTDYKGNKYLDPLSKEVWDYNINIANKSYNLGFDEINFDYVRFPTDGVLTNIYYPFSDKIIIKNPKWGKIIIIDRFSTYITSKLRELNPKIILSADVFGLVTSSNLYNIGQNLESFLLNFDYVGPMIYPSHYGEGYSGFGIPDNYPYEIITGALNNAIFKIDKLNKSIDNINSATGSIDLPKLLIGGVFTPEKSIYKIKKIEKTKIRAWIQGFSCTWCRGATLYNRTKFRKQIKAIEAVGLNSWRVWNSASNYYYEWY